MIQLKKAAWFYHVGSHHCQVATHHNLCNPKLFIRKCMLRLVKPGPQYHLNKIVIYQTACNNDNAPIKPWMRDLVLVLHLCLTPRKIICEGHFCNVTERKNP